MQVKDTGGICRLMSWAPKGWLLEPDPRPMQDEGA